MEFIKIVCETENLADTIMVFSKDKEKTIETLNNYTYKFNKGDINCSYDEYLEDKGIQFVVVSDIATKVEI